MILKYSHNGFDLEGFSEGGIRTSITVKNLDLMFDIGGLNHDKVHINNLLISHGHLDHSAGIPYYISQRSLQKLKSPNIYVPQEMYYNLDKILKIYSEMEGFDYNYNLKIATIGEHTLLNKRYSFCPFKTNHRIPSLGYIIHENVRKLKAEFFDLPSTKITEIKANGIELTELKQTPIICFGGDTTFEYIVENKDAMESKILIIECTYLDETRDLVQAKKWGHTHLDELIHHANSFKNETIVLIHFSKRYSNYKIRELIQKKVPDGLRERIHCFVK